ncbi:hypothetical protein TPHV1_20082 [Treponema phagedenis]|uniref:Uncharacterized protein n=1 Tax=Treponema phagedenis TaxID=162 RepID=A0A0B7GXA2_TREPH|nr:hypothetical protein TPHV1_20082 [Treponema phagedenis]
MRQYRNTPIQDTLKGLFKKLLATVPEDTVSVDTFLDGRIGEPYFGAGTGY